MIAVAIDGPSGAGKSTLARAAAKELGFVYVDTGAMYRAISLYIMEQAIDPSDSQSIIAALSNIKLKLAYHEGVQRIFLWERDVSEEIRSPEVTQVVPVVSAIQQVRDFLRGYQRELALRQNIIMDGRDIGTVVLPDAQVKIFLTASAEIRAQRRYDEYIAKGKKVSYNEVLKDMEARDEMDSVRTLVAEDAIVLDSSGMSFSQALKRIIQIIKDCDVI